MKELNLGDLVEQPYGTHQHFSVSVSSDFIIFWNNMRVESQFILFKRAY